MGSLSYQVFVSGQSALRVRQFGFVGLYLWIEGDLENAGEIIAEKIGFLDFSNSGEPETIFSSERVTLVEDGRNGLNAYHALH